MRTILLTAIICACLCTVCYAQKILPINGSARGFFEAGGHGFLKVTTPADGRLNLTLKSPGYKSLVITLYDHNQTTVIGETSTHNKSTLSADLASGTFYITVHQQGDNKSSAFEVSDSFAAAAEPNDAEPNNTKNGAALLPVNGSVKGHIDYYYEGEHDKYDWYKLVTHEDGALKITLRNTAGNDNIITAILFARDGATKLGVIKTSTEGIYINQGMDAGIYFVRLGNHHNNKYAASYTLSDTLTVNGKADVEPNNLPKDFIDLPLNQTLTGHINFYDQSNYIDTFDWYKVTTTERGTLTLTFYNFTVGGTELWQRIVASDTVTVKAEGWSPLPGPGSYYFRNLPATTLFIRVGNKYAGAIAYSISSKFDAGNKAPGDDSSANIMVQKMSAVEIDGASGKATGDFVRAYPNPATSQLNIQLSSLTAKGSPAQLKLINAQGETVWANKAAATGNIVIDVRSLPSGIYYLNVYVNGKILTQKVIIAR